MGRARIHTRMTLATTRWHWLVIAEFYRQKQLAKEEHAAGMWDYELMIATCPPKSCLNSPITFKYWSRVAEGTILVEAKCLGQLTQLALNHIVIVFAKSVSCKLWFTLGQGIGRRIIKRHRHYALQAIHKQAWVETLVGIVLEICHRGMSTLAYPLLVRSHNIRVNGIGFSYATCKKPRFLASAFILEIIVSYPYEDNYWLSIHSVLAHSYSNVLNSKPWSLSHFSERGSAVRSLPILLSES